MFLALTGHAAEADEERGGSGVRRLVTDTLVIAERNLVRLPRAPELLLAFTVQPIMFVLLFRYVFGGAISTPGYSYADYLIPGIIVQNIAFGGFVTALGLNEDLHKGLIDRFRSLPMARAAVLAGRTLADVVTNALSATILVITGLIIGFSLPHERAAKRSPASACCCCSATPSRGCSRFVGMLVNSRRSRQLGRLHRRLPAHLHLLRVRAGAPRCPKPLQAFAELNPFTIIVDAMRALWLGAPAGNYVWGAFVWSVAIIAVFAPLAVARYRRATAV